MNKAARELRAWLKKQDRQIGEEYKDGLRLLSAALREERERCAKVAHAEVHTWKGPIAEANREMVANGVADAIRRGK